MTLAMTCLVVLMATGCELEEVKPPANVKERPLAVLADAAWLRMHERFDAAYQIEEAISRGDLRETQAQAHTLTQLNEPDPLLRWKPYFDNVVSAAQEVEHASDLTLAATSAAALGRQCARCHEQLTTKIHITRDPFSTHGDDGMQQMRRHQWAASHMWEGLIGPSDELWNEGARDLATIQFTASSATSSLLGDWFNPDVVRIRSAAARALELGDQDDRQAVFGELLATCVHCHQAYRGH